MQIEITKMTSRGQIVIPQDIRIKKSIKDGEKFLVYDLDDNIILKRITNVRHPKNIDDFEKTFHSMRKIAKQRGITRQDVAAEIILQRKENGKINT